MNKPTMSRMAQKKRESLKFLENFDPEKSTRERKKLIRKVANNGRKNTTLYDAEGRIDGKDLCDCLEQTCPGCHFPCPKCQSLKCGPECRVNRKWAYLTCEIEGTNN